MANRAAQLAAGTASQARLAQAVGSFLAKEPFPEPDLDSMSHRHPCRVQSCADAHNEQEQILEIAALLWQKGGINYGK
jgi:hypothetical protein